MRWSGVLAVCAMAVTALVASVMPSSCRDCSAPDPHLRRVPAQKLPRSLGISVAPFEIAWAPGLLAAISMYFPSELEILEVIHSQPTREKAVDLARRVGAAISSATIAELPAASSEGEECYRWEFGSLDVSVFRDGNAGMTWWDRDLPPDRLTAPEANPAPRITAEEAIAVADKFLKDASLLPEGACLTEVTPLGLTSCSEQANGKVYNKALSWSVTYRRYRSGIPEGRLAVWVTGRGEIFSFSRNMREVRSLGRYPLLSPDEAKGMIWSSTARVETGVNAPEGRPVRGTIEKVEMEYYDGATAWSYDTIQPAFIFTGTAWDCEGRPQSFKAMVPALRPECLDPT